MRGASHSCSYCSADCCSPKSEIVCETGTKGRKDVAVKAGRKVIRSQLSCTSRSINEGCLLNACHWLTSDECSDTDPILRFQRFSFQGFSASYHDGSIAVDLHMH